MIMKILIGTKHLFVIMSKDNKNNQDRIFKDILTKSVPFSDAKKHGINMSDDCIDFISQCLKKEVIEETCMISYINCVF